MINSTAVLGFPSGLMPKANKISGLTESAKSRVSRQIADLRWRIEFTEMKLHRWEGYENNRWYTLVQMQEQAKRELKSLTGQSIAFN